jgi:ribosomal protein S6--L-glutamate ligase
MPAAVMRVLSESGIDIETLCPGGNYFDTEKGVLISEDGSRRRLNDYDVIVSRNRNPLGLSMLYYAESAGIMTMNTHSSIQKVRNKAEMGIAMALQGIPSATTFLADHASALAGVMEKFSPLILKATYGDNSQGLRVIRNPLDLGDLHWGNDLALAQHFIQNNGFDLKLYVCGKSVFAVRKPSPVNGNPSGRTEVIKPSNEMVKLALKCGEIFGLDIYGVDTIETDNGPVVIEVNDFPNFTGINGADELIAGYIMERINNKGSKR